jgi:hypothetical protein
VRLSLPGLGLLAAVLLALAGPSTAAAAPVPVRVCEENREWRRPSPAEMAATVWRDNRYRDPATGAVNDRTLAYYTHHFLFFTIVSASGTDHALDLTGLKTARPRGLCMPPYDEALGRGRDVVIWALGYRVAAADVTGSTLTLTVAPNSPALDRGYTIVRVPRPGGFWYPRFVLPDGREVARASSPDFICCAEEPALDDPAQDARAALARFMDARLARDGPAALALVTDGLRARSPNAFVGQSNPCFYRYAVEAFGRTTPTATRARVRVYTHLWPGDTAGGPPNSAAEEIGLVRTAAGWRVDDVRLLTTWRGEPGEPHGPHTSACTVGRRPADWLPAVLPAAGGPAVQVVPLAGALGLALVAAGLMVRRP